MTNTIGLAADAIEEYSHMKKIIVYTMNYCPYCEAAKKLLKSKGWDFQEVLLEEDDDAGWKKLEKQTGYKTMPQIFFGDKFIGGYSDMTTLDKQGKLEELVK